MRKTIMLAAFAATMALAPPAAAQSTDRPYDLGALWDVTAIDVEDGHFEEYMAFLADRWRSNQEFARSQGWILEYHVLANNYPRQGEPDLYLITRYADYPSAAEIRRRDAAFMQHLSSNPRTQDQEFGQRGSMRRIGSNMMLREMTFPSQ